MAVILRYPIHCSLAMVACLCSCGGDRARDTAEAEEDSLLNAPPAVRTVEEEMELAAREPDEPKSERLSFNDFFFLFLRSKRFQAEHIKFPLSIEEADASGREITSGAVFRDYFRWPEGEEYTLLLPDARQMSDFQSGEGLDSVSAEVIDLKAMELRSYDFLLSDSVWQLRRIRNYEPQGNKGDFLHFYAQFATDTVFQDHHLARQIHFTSPDPDDDTETIEGILLPAQWPAFRPDMPSEVLTNFDFGQPLDEARRITLLQCGMASGMMRAYTFHLTPLGWELHSFGD